MQIGILQTGDSPDEIKAKHGSYADLFIRLLAPVDDSFEFRVFRVLEGQLPDSPQDCDAWLITGSRFSAYDPEPWIPPLKQFIRQIAASEQPLVGICFGHQIIAEALGGKVEKSAKGWGLGIDTYDLTAASPAGQATRIKLNLFHQDQVVKLPANAEVFASSAFCEYAGYYVGDRIMTIQAHPEFQADFYRDLVNVRKSVAFSEAQARAALDSLESSDTRTDSSRVAQWIGAFLRTGKTGKKTRSADCPAIESGAPDKA